MKRTLLLAVAASLLPLGSVRAQAEEEEAAQPADDASPDEAAREEQARAVFQAGRVAYENGDFEAALGYFRSAIELSDRPALWFNVGMAAMQLRRDTEALEAFEVFLRMQPDAPNAGQVRARVALLRASIARASEDDAAGGSEGDLVPAAIAFGVAGAGLVAFAVLGGLALAERDALAASCGATRRCTDEQVSTMTTLGAAADASWVIAAVAAAAGVVLLVALGLPGADGEESARLVPWMTPDAGGAWAEVRF